MEEQSLDPEIDPALSDALDSVDPPFLLPDENPVESIASAEAVSPQVEEETELDDDAADDDVYVEEPQRLVVGTRRRAPARPDYVPAPASRGTGCADLITAIFLLMTVAVCAFTLLLIIYPRSPLNPFPVPAFPTMIVLASPAPTDTPTNTFTPLPATETPTATPTFTPTATYTATWTPSATFTPVVGGVPIVTSSPTVKPEATQPQYTLSPFAFTVDPLRYIANSGPDGCNWQSIVVITKDLAHNPVKGIAFRVTGGGGNIDEVDYTGNVPRFGDGSFELVLGTVPREDQFTIQVLSRNGQQISDTVTIGTHTDCKQNVVVVTFVQNHEY
jgi:hypothetical protein